MIPWTALVLLMPAVAPPPDFALRDGDTVVFLGDSITAAGTYGKFVEQYTLLRFPDRRVRFVNAGKGGDTAAGGLRRLQRDVFDRGATVVIVAFGFNDIGWGVWADAAHRRAYLDAVAGIVAACRRRNVRPVICSAAITGADPFRSETDFFQRMCDDGLAVARAGGAATIDVQRGMREVQKRVWRYNDQLGRDGKGKETLHAADGVHLNDLGQLAMAFAILRGLHAPRTVSTATLDARAPAVVDARGCTVTALERTADELRFTRTDRGLPFNHGIFFALHYRFVPVPDELNRYMLRVLHLPAGRYEVRADDRLVGAFTAAQLASGVNVASATGNAWEPGGPWNAQADVLRSLVEARHQLGLAEVQAHAYLPGRPVTGELDRGAEKVNADLETLQRTVARPRPYRFVVRRLTDRAKPAEAKRVREAETR